MEDQQKLAILRKLDTKNIIEGIEKCENELENELKKEADFKGQNYGYLCSEGRDCAEVKRILAELSIKVPEAGDEGKKFTVADRDAWLLRQRKENEELDKAIIKQREVAFLLDDYQIKVEIAKKRLESRKVILNLKTAQLNFLAS